jgi:hypothetical protein
MTKELLSKNIIAVHNKTVELEKKIDAYHSENVIEKRKMNSSQFNYLLSFLTMVNYIKDKIDFLLNCILIFNRKSKRPITKRQVYMLIEARKRLKRMEKKQKYFLE